MSRSLGNALVGCLFAPVLFAALPVYAQSNDSTDAYTTARLLDVSWGMRVKLVWARLLRQGHTGDNLGPDHALVAFDTEGGGERVLQATPGTYDRPFITRDGTRVIWNDQTNAESWICNWDGSGKTRLFKGDNATTPAHVASTRWDGATNTHYIYVGTAQSWSYESLGGMVEAMNIYEYPLNGLTVDTTRRRKVWDGGIAGSGVCGATHFTVNADGKYGAGQMSGGVNCLGFVDLTSMEVVQTRAPEAGALGCVPNCSPDNQRMWFHFMAGHSWIYFYRYGGRGNRIYCRPDSLYKDIPGVFSYDGMECVRWSNHPRFFTGGASMTFPEDITWEEQHFKWKFYLGRFDAGYTKVEEWVQVSHNPRFYTEFNGDAWFDAEATSEARPGRRVPAMEYAPRGGADGVVHDILGRRIAAAGAGPRAMAVTGPTGVCVENGRIRLIVR